MKTAQITFLLIALNASLLGVAAERADQDGPERWARYMHGVQDHGATPIRTESLSNAPDVKDIQLVNIDSKDFPTADSPSLSTVVLKREQQIVVPVPIEAAAIAGKKIRLFAWVKSEGAVRSSNSYAAAPNFSLIFLNESGNRLSRTSTITISTARDFPWHCYYLDAHIPASTAAIKLELKAGQSGQASFAKFSWKNLSGKQLSANDRQDPYTGSTASNVYYDGMTGQLRYGLGTRYPWRFLKGPAAGMKGLPFDLTTTSGLKEYFDYARTDSDEMNHGVMYLAGLYRRGLKAGVLPEGINEAWLQKLTEYVINAQDSTTGYWGSTSAPQSMGITFHFVEGLFPSRGLDRHSPSPTARQDERQLATTEIPRANQIVDTTLRMQATEPSRPAKKAGWPRVAYNFTDAPNQSQQRASLAVTGNAIELLRRAEPFVDEGRKAKIYDAISAAVLYVLRTCVQDDGVWKQSDTDPSPSNPWYMERILDKSHYLEYRHNSSVPKPNLETASTKGTVDLRWVAPVPGQNSLRVYRWKTNADVDRFIPDNLIAIMESPSGDSRLSDPFITAWRMNRAAISRWGTGWKKGSYILDRVSRASLETRTTVVQPGGSFKVKIDSAETIAITAVNTYGEESEPLIVGISPL
ncbi:hypothetical protein [Hydrocarboniphaga effusa]|uniref:hypothetical protein n=1 Tax=Hydrocarboniphaga effusa TaxID=243629 RepID=UPI00398C0AAD